MPVWHVSSSIMHRGNRVTAVRIRPVARRLALAVAEGVGSQRGYWWWWNDVSAVGHLRVPVTVDEARVVTENGGRPSPYDAGPEGTWISGRAIK